MAQVFLYPATGESPLDEDGNPFPSTGLRVTMNAYYEGQCRQGLLVRQDPNAFSSVAQPAVYAPVVLGYTLSQLSTLEIQRDGQIVETTDSGTYSGALNAGSGDVATTNGYWNLISANDAGAVDGVLVSELSGFEITAETDGQIKFVSGYAAENDGGQGLWYAKFGDSTTANGWECIAATGGRWRRIFDQRIVAPQWFGAFPGGTASANKTALIAALDAARSGYSIEGSNSETPMNVDGMVLSTGDTLGGLKLRNLRITKTTSAGGITDPGAVLALIQSPSFIDGVTVDGCNLQGNSSTADLVKALQFGFAKQVRIKDVRFGNQALEGIYWPGTASCEGAYITGCHGEASGLSTGTPLSAYNINSSRCVMIGNTAKNVGRFIEHTGDMLAVVGNLFEQSAVGVTGVMLQSTTQPNQLAVMVGNCIRNTDLAISITDHTRSLGKALIANNVIYEARQGISAGSKLAFAQPLLIADNVAINSGGVESAAAGTCFFNIGGGNVWQGNLAACPRGTTTGTIGSGSQTTMTVPNDATNMHEIVPGTTFTVVGITGTKTCTAVSADRGTVTFTPATTDGPVTNAAVTFTARPWVYLFRGFYNDEPTIKDNTFLDIPWSGTAFRFHAGCKFTITRNVWNPRGQSYGSTPLIQILDGGGGVLTSTQLLASDMDVTKDWTISPYRLRSEIWTNGVDPAALPWKVGDIVWYTAPTAGGFIGQVCTVAGTEGTLAGTVTATTTLGSASVTLAGGAYLGAGVYVDCHITIAGVSGVKRVVSVSGASCVVDSVCDAAVGPGAAVAYSAPTWRTFGAVS